MRANDAVGRWEARGDGMTRHGHSGTGADEQVAADGAGVGDLAFTHGGGSCPPCPSLAELVDLMDQGTQISLATLVEPSGH